MQYLVTIKLKYVNIQFLIKSKYKNKMEVIIIKLTLHNRNFKIRMQII